MRTIAEIKADIEYLKQNDMDNTVTADCMKELLRYRELERDGRLVVLPCKVGDTVWVKSSFFNNNIEQAKVINARHDGFNYKVVCEGIGERTYGKTVFLTKAEAEKALKDGKV
ncbi:MAG: hypothetical protein M0R40_00560 [Firmicutes bacterium]|nr:hypothetical protein [Bacillota bacterium]